MRSLLSLSTALLVLSGGFAALGQGTVIFNNSDAGLVKWGFEFNIVPVPPGAGKVQLYWAPAGTAYVPWTPSLTPAVWYASNPGWSLVPPPTTMSEPGRFDGGTLLLEGFYGPSPGGAIDYVVIGWTGTAPSFDAALAAGALIGITGKLTSGTGDPNASPPGSPVSLANTFPGLILTVPEPSSLSLTALGALLFRARRRKSR